ncbi:MAG: XrtA system polysaccharide chain length determinant [Nitrospirota bacterium]
MTNSANPAFDIKTILTIILRRKYIALLVALTVISIFTWGSFFIPNVYEASSTVFVEQSSIVDPLIRGVGVTRSIEERLINLRDSITSRNILERVMKKLDLDVKVKNPGQYEEIIRNIRNNLNLRVQGGSRANLFVISFTANDPKTASSLVNTLVSEYIEESQSMTRTDAYSAYDFIQNQVLEYKKRLEESDGAIREFRERNPNLVPQSENTLIGRIETFQTARIDAEIRLKELTRKRENLQKQLSGEKELTVAFISNDSSPQGRLNSLNNQLVILLSKYTDNYPEVIKVKHEIEELKRQISQAKASPHSSGSETAAINPIYQQIRQELTNTEAEIESLRGRISELSRQQQGSENILGRMPKEQEEWTKLQRDRNVYQRIYDELLQKLENARVSKDLEVTNKAGIFRVVDPAIVPPLPKKPDRVKMILFGLFFGITSGIGAAFGLDYLSHSFKDEATIESRLKLSVLATIPKIVTEEDVLSGKKLDRKVFTAAAAYLIVIGVVLTVEFLHRYIGIKIINF